MLAKLFITKIFAIILLPNLILFTIEISLYYMTKNIIHSVILLIILYSNTCWQLLFVIFGIIILILELFLYQKRAFINT